MAQWISARIFFIQPFLLNLHRIVGQPNNKSRKLSPTQLFRSPNHSLILYCDVYLFDCCRTFVVRAIPTYIIYYIHFCDCNADEDDGVSRLFALEISTSGSTLFKISSWLAHSLFRLYLAREP